MMFTSDDFRIESVADFFMFLPIVIFMGLVAPFLIAAYSLGFAMNMAGWLD